MRERVAEYVETIVADSYKRGQEGRDIAVFSYEDADNLLSIVGGGERSSRRRMRSRDGFEHDECPDCRGVCSPASELNPEQVARWFHDAYEELAPRFGYETRTESAVPFDQIPVSNRQLMVATASVVLGQIDVARKEAGHETL